MIKIRIKNADHEIDIRFPISESELFAKLGEIHAIEGKEAPQSAFVTEVYWPEEFSMLKDRFANLDELNYLARRMESFDYHEYDQFLIGITKLENPTEKDLINLTFNLDHFTLCKDVSSYGKIGREYVMNTEGAVPAHDEDDPKYAAIGKDLIDRGLAQHGHHLAAGILRRQHVDIAAVGIADEAEFELGCVAEDLLQALRVLQARHLHQDAVEALALDVRLGCPERVDAPAQNLHSLLDGTTDALVRTGFRHDELDQPVGLLGDVDRLVAGRPEGAERADRLGELTQLRHHAGALRGVRDAHLDTACRRLDAALDTDALLAQDAADVVAQLRHLAAHQLGPVDLEQDVGPALQVEAEHHGMNRQEGPRNPGRCVGFDGLARLRRQEVRHGEPTADEQHEQDEDDLAGLETKHLREQPCYRARAPSAGSLGRRILSS